MGEEKPLQLMNVLTVISRKTGALGLARLGYRVARALEGKLWILCVDEGQGSEEPVVMLPGRRFRRG